MKDSTGLETSTKIYVISHLQPDIFVRIQRGLAILILEFDDMMVKRLFI